MERLFSYKMTQDRGFAPCPFGGFLTLATCKPQIRLYKNIGDWIAGFTAKNLNSEYLMIYLMKIEKKITFYNYWNNKIYEIKKPKLHSNNRMDVVGDNIYKPNTDDPVELDNFEQIENLFHKTKNKESDLSGVYVLVSNIFYYFGSNPIKIPENIIPEIAKGRDGHGKETDNEERKIIFLNYIQEKYKIGIYNAPHKWKKNDITWKNDVNYVGK